jgi:hypothetical protein
LDNKTTPKKRISLFKRSPQEINFMITQRDLDILISINKYRYLSTNQVHNLLFSDNTTLQSARRRLKYLFHHKYIGRVIPYIQPGVNNGITAYFLDKTGSNYLKELGHKVKLWSKAKRIKHRNLSHALALSEFCISFDKAVEKTPELVIEKFIPDFEMKSSLDKSFGNRRYTLYTEVIHSSSQKSYTVYPDALILISIELKGKTYKRLIFLEIDMGTMGMDKLRDKLIGYKLYLDKKHHLKYLQAENFRLLFQTTSPKRAENIKNTFADMKGADLVWITDENLVNQDTILNKDIWRDTQGIPHCIYKPNVD